MPRSDAPVLEPPPRAGSRLRWIGAAIVLALLAGFLVVRMRATDTDAHPVDGVYRLDEAGLRYTYQAVTNMEGLFDLRSDPGCLENLAESRAADVTRLRAKLTERLGVEKLEDLRDAYREQIELLESLGYL